MVSKEYQFPEITEDMHSRIAKWHRYHNRGKCHARFHGTIGGDVSFEIVPTSIGEFITVKCSCGAKLDISNV